VGCGSGSTTTARGWPNSLYVSYQIVRSHGGELSVEAAERGGTRFEVWLPADPEQERD
jgi:signal transduction histidine kinase